MNLPDDLSERLHEAGRKLLTEEMVAEEKARIDQELREQSQRGYAYGEMPLAKALGLSIMTRQLAPKGQRRDVKAEHAERRRQRQRELHDFRPLPGPSKVDQATMWRDDLGYPIHEIAQALNINVKTAYAYVARGRAKRRERKNSEK